MAIYCFVVKNEHVCLFMPLFIKNKTQSGRDWALIYEFWF